MVSAVRRTSQILVGCTNYYAVTITVPQAGNIVITTSAHWWIDHTSGTKDRIALMHRTSATDCNVGMTDNQAFFMEVAPEVGSDTIINQAGTHVSLLSVAAAGTYTYYLNFVMRAGESSLDQVIEATSIAVFYPT